mmetsp:Transcript_39941/g.64044  ORF Transcript_39941/g.64044 Transcript_39941/m.64044 type:complete len:160 (-) Transcript_39941:950-1429(-)|eukprot:jgi/Bigna1/77542/fgenesh1_pg.48_\
MYTLLVGLLVILKPALAAQCGDWLLAPPGESCDIHCGGKGSTGLSGKLCDEKYMWDHQGEIDTQAEMQAVMTDLGFPCQSFSAASNANHAPGYKTSNGQCILSAPNRPVSSFKCDVNPATPADRRLCFCYIQHCVHLKIGDYPMQGCRWHPERKNTCRG